MNINEIFLKTLELKVCVSTKYAISLEIIVFKSPMNNHPCTMVKPLWHFKFTNNHHKSISHP